MHLRVVPIPLCALLAAALAASGAAAASPHGKPSLRRHVESATLLRNGRFDGGVSGWAGWNATLAPATDGRPGGAVLVRLRSGGDFSLFPTPTPVASTTAGTVYTAVADVRAAGRSRQLCLRIREWAGGALAGSALRCVDSSSSWQSIPPVSYRAQASGRKLDVYLYQWNARRGDSFEADNFSLAADVPAQLPVNATAPAAPPAQASALAASAADFSHVRLSWTAVPGAVAYRVSRGGFVTGTTTDTSFTDAMLWPSTSYSYGVDALAADGSTIATLIASATTPALPASGFPRPFAASSFWNTPVGNAPLDPRSAAKIAYFAANSVRYPNMALQNWATAVAESRPGDAVYDVPCTAYSCSLGALGAIPIPSTAQPDPSGDGHLVVVDPGTSRAWGMWGATRGASGWTAGAGEAVSTTGNGLAPAGPASSNAAGFALLGGLIRPEEILQGRIDHALVFGIPGVAAGRPVCPATGNQGGNTNPLALPEGTRLQLDPSVNVDALPIPAWEKTIARAMQVYGMYLRDGSGTLSIGAENPVARGYDAWSLVGLSGDSVSLAGIPWGSFRVIAAPSC